MRQQIRLFATIIDLQKADRSNSLGAIYIEIWRWEGKAITRHRALMGKTMSSAPQLGDVKTTPQHRPCSKWGAKLQTCLSLRARWMISHIKTGCWNCDSGKGKIKCLFAARFRRARATFLTFRYCTPISLQIKAATAKRLIITEIESFIWELDRQKFYNSLCNYESGKTQEQRQRININGHLSI